MQTTSQYLIRNVETTVNEDALPGKLPETPLRAEPPSSYKVNQAFGVLFIRTTSIYGYGKENKYQHLK